MTASNTDPTPRPEYGRPHLKLPLGGIRCGPFGDTPYGYLQGATMEAATHETPPRAADLGPGARCRRAERDAALPHRLRHRRNRGHGGRDRARLLPLGNRRARRRPGLPVRLHAYQPAAAPSGLALSSSCRSPSPPTRSASRSWRSSTTRSCSASPARCTPASATPSSGARCLRARRRRRGRLPGEPLADHTRQGPRRPAQQRPPPELPHPCGRRGRRPAFVFGSTVLLAEAFTSGDDSMGPRDPGLQPAEKATAGREGRRAGAAVPGLAVAAHGLSLELDRTELPRGDAPR